MLAPQGAAPWRLQEYGRVLEGRPGRVLRSPVAAAVESLGELVWQRSGVVIGPEQGEWVEMRLQPLLARSGLADLAALVARVEQAPEGALMGAVLEAVIPRDTWFFRDLRPFTHLANVAFPGLAAARPVGTPVRVWSAGSSSGQEAYSVAMVAAETMPEHPVQVLGTDIAAAPVGEAQAGIYTQHEVQRGISARRLLLHFERLERGWRLEPALRAACQFGVGNLLHDPAPLGVFDVILCRNVLRYFDTATGGLVLGALVRQLVPDGWLYLGTTEAEGVVPGMVEGAETGAPIYRRAG